VVPPIFVTTVRASRLHRVDGPGAHVVAAEEDRYVAWRGLTGEECRGGAAFVSELRQHPRTRNRRIGIGSHDALLLDALEPFNLAEDPFAAVATEIPIVGISGRPVAALELRFGADFSFGDRIEALRDAIADRIHRGHVRGHGGDRTISGAAASSIAGGDDAAE
jgi:hypothetical protein